MSTKEKNSELKVGTIILSRWADDSIHINEITLINHRLNECKLNCIKCLRRDCGEHSINTYPLDSVIRVSQILTDEVKGLYL
jgi:hypothetical protein